MKIFLLIAVLIGLGAAVFEYDVCGMRSLFSSKADSAFYVFENGDTCTPPSKEGISRHLKQNKRFATLVKERTPIENGFLFKFSTADVKLDELKEFVEFEQECCKFMTFQVDSESHKDEIWVSVTAKKGEHPEFFELFLSKDFESVK